MPTTVKEYVISGISGKMPNSKDLDDFILKLYNGVHMVDDKHNRWNKDLPSQMGTIYNEILENIDHQFFGLSPLQATYTDPQMRMLLECTHEAIIDSGYNPSDLRGSKTGVYIGAITSDLESYFTNNANNTCGTVVTGCSTFMFSNRLSFQFDFKGPSLTVNTACSSSMYAFGLAFKDLIEGRCDAAIVGGVNIILEPKRTAFYYEGGLCSSNGACRTFDKNADGFVRSESCGVIFLQKKSVARRNYASVLNVSLNTDGWKKQGLVHPDRNIQYQLLCDSYNSINIDPDDVCFIETHGPGSKAGDPEEVAALASFFCNNRKTPLVVGSVKSNIGHCEGAAAISSVLKMIIAMEAGVIPANINLSEINPKLESIIDGRINVADQNLPWNGGIIGISSFGLGGANGHAILKSNVFSKNNYPPEQLSRLIVVSGRTTDGIERILNIVESHADDAEYLALVNQVYCKDIPQNTCRGYMLMSNGKSLRGIENVPGELGDKRPVWYIYSGMGSQWTSMGKILLQIDVTRNSLHRCAEVLKPLNIDLIEIMTKDDPSLLNTVLNPFITITAVQIAITDLLSYLGITPDGFLGHSLGEMVCGYADGCLTLEQTMMLSYWRGHCFEEIIMQPMLMASIGLSWDSCMQRKPKDVELICNNGASNVSIAGPLESIKKFVGDLTRDGIFAREIKSSGVISHCHYSDCVSQRLLMEFRKIIPSPQERSNRWLSTSLPEKEWDSPISKYCSPEYQVNNVRFPVLFHETVQHVPQNAICIEIAPHGLFQSILRKTLSNETTNICLMKRNISNVDFTIENIGKLYIAGCQPDVTKLYHPVNFPVGRQTPMLNKLADWDHSTRFPIPKLETKNRDEEICFEINLATDDAFIAGHFIDGRIIYPATGYIILVWKAFAQLRQAKFDKIPIILENIGFHRATIIPKDGKVILRINILKSTGKFEVCEGEGLVLSGKVRSPENIDLEFRNFDKFQTEDSGLVLDSNAIYKDFRLRGYDYSGQFRGILSADSLGSTAKLNWDNNWIAFLDTILQCTILSKNTRDLYLPIGIRKFIIDPNRHMDIISKLNEKNIPLRYFKKSSVIECAGVQVYGIDSAFSSKKVMTDLNMLERYSFIPYINMEKSDHALTICLQICLENSGGILKYKIADIANNISLKRILAPLIQEIIEREPLLLGDVTVYTTESAEECRKNISSVPDIAVVNKNILSGPIDQGCNLVIGYDVVQNHESQTILFHMMSSILDNKGFILLQESIVNYDFQKFNNLFSMLNLILVSVQRSGDKFLILLRSKADTANRNSRIIHVTEKSLDWLNDIKSALAEADKEKSYVYIISRGEPTFGAVGLVNCLQHEQGGKYVRLFFVPDARSGQFSFSNKTYVDQLKKDFLINVLKGNQWGSYRHLKFDKILDRPLVNVEEAYIDTVIPSDVSSLNWIQSLNSIEMPIAIPEKIEICTVYYVGLNFKDVLLASGKLNPSNIGGKFGVQETALGHEFAGRDSKGQRVFGFRLGDTFATTVQAVSNLLWKIPDNWTMVQAATISVVYATVYYCLVQQRNINKGESILIHAGSGGVGQAAISVALSYGLKVFTTVSSKEKMKYVQKMFPVLTDDCFGNSRDTSFEQFVLEATNGEGVDIVLNSLADDKLVASLNCLKENGRFLEIGRVDIVQNSQIGLRAFFKNIKFVSLYLDPVVISSVFCKEEFVTLISEGMKSGTVRPLTTTVFNNDEIEKAFRFLSSGKHVGKVVIKLRDEEDIEGPYIPRPQLRKAIPKTFFYKDKSYILVGGLGGFGLEVAGWMISRNARKIILTSRTGIKTPYQSLLIKRWTESGVYVRIDTNDITTESGAIKLFEEAIKIGPIGGIFNLAVILRDNLLEDQTETDFNIVCGPKSVATKYLDTLSRELCPYLDYFICFSSLTSGRGNIGQTNYGMANSVMERICENRRTDGLPGTAIQWGAIGDTGIVIDSLGNNETVIRGTKPQKINSCLEVLDMFMQSPQPILSSMVLAEKKNVGAKSSMSLAKIIGNILGIRDLKNIGDDASLSSLGVDSLMLVEIKQILDRNFNCTLSNEEIRQLNMKKLRDIESGTKSNQKTLEVRVLQVDLGGEYEVFFTNELTPSEPLVHVNKGLSPSTNKRPLFICTAIENSAEALKPLALKLKWPVWALQCTKDLKCTSALELAKYFVNKIKSIQKTGPYSVAGYSFGALISYEIAVLLENEGHQVHLIELDGSPEYIAFIKKKIIKNITESDFSPMSLGYFGALYTNLHLMKTIQELMLESTLDNQVKKLVNKIHAITNDPCDQLEQTIRLFYMRCQIVRDYVQSSSFKSSVTLIKPTINHVTLPDDYGLSKICEQKVQVFIVDGDHRSFMTDDNSSANLAKIIDTQLSEYDKSIAIIKDVKDV